MPHTFYNFHAQSLAEQYLSKPFEQIHCSWLHLLQSFDQQPSLRILDIGAGAGRDSSYLAQRWPNTATHVVAVEPANALAEIGQRQTAGLSVQWLNDSLPLLNKVTRQEVNFDLILLSAVWMHIPISDRPRALRKLVNLLKPGGKLVITLRHGSSSDEGKMHRVSSKELLNLGKNFGLFAPLITPLEDDQLGRETIQWQTVVLQLPDDGSGAFPFIRHVALNDGKSATHKLALMRVLLRIADGHPGAVIRREDDRVILPVGLVALYWCHQYKILIDKYQLFQTPNSNPNMGFMKDNGWHQLDNRAASDFCIGNLFTGNDALALHRTLSAAVHNIRDMPCRYITWPQTDQSVFEINSQRVPAKDSLFLDLKSLSAWGEFSMPETIWLAFSRFACWIEPVLVNEWANTMRSYQGNKCEKKQQLIPQALVWLSAKRSTEQVRKRFEHLQQRKDQRCVWSQRLIKTNTKQHNSVQIDHCFPFARWPNNDLWNLLPSAANINLEKSDRLPSQQRLKRAQPHINQWWQDAWLEEQDPLLQRQFFAQANIALPGLDNDNQSLDDLFQAMTLQQIRLKEMQQLKEW